MAKSKNWIQLNRRIRAAEKAAGMTQEDHKSVVLRLTGKQSLSDCSEREMQNVLNAVQGDNKPSFKPSSKGFVRKIWALWGDLDSNGLLHTLGTENKRQALVSFVNRIVGTDFQKPQQLDWLTSDQATQVIEALKQWQARERRNAA